MDNSEDHIYESISEKNWVERKGWAPELVNTILERLRKSNPSLKKEKRVVIVWSKEINAYAVTGDYVYISRALLEKCPNEESAAFFIAHELAHHNLGHLEMVPDWAKRFPFLLLLLFVIYHHLRSCFTPRVECEADLAGLNYCLNAGYDPAKCIASFDILENEALNRRSMYTAFGPDDESDNELNENASFKTKFFIWLYYLRTRSLPIRDRREYLLQKLEAQGFPREKRRRVAQRI